MGSGRSQNLFSDLLGWRSLVYGWLGHLDRVLAVCVGFAGVSGFSDGVLLQVDIWLEVWYV